MTNTTDMGNYHTCFYPRVSYMFVLRVKVQYTIRLINGGGGGYYAIWNILWVGQYLYCACDNDVNIISTQWESKLAF